jgi:hypothetical protein
MGGDVLSVLIVLGMLMWEPVIGHEASGYGFTALWFYGGVIITG